MKKHLTLLLFCLTACISAQAQIFPTATVVPDGGLPSNATCIFREPGGYIWAGTSDGLVRISHHSVRIYKADGEENALLGDNILSISLDSSGAVCIVTNNGVVRYDKARDNFQHIANSDFPEKGKMHSDGVVISSCGTLEGTPFGGIISIKDSGFKTYKISGSVVGVQNEPVIAICQGASEDELIITTTQGDYLFNTESGEARRATPLQVKRTEQQRDNGEFSPDSMAISAAHRLYDRIDAVVYDASGNVWAGTDKGVVVYNPESKKSKFFGPSVGAAEGRYSPDAAIICKNGKIVLGGSFGFTVINPLKADLQSVEPVVEIADIIIDGKRIPNITRVDLPENHKSIVINILAREGDILREKVYKFRVKGGIYGDGYEIVSKDPTVTPNLVRKGNYTIEAACSTADGEWSGYKQLLTVAVRALWYKHPVLNFALILVLLVLVCVLRRRKRFEAQSEYVKESPVKENNTVPAPAPKPSPAQSLTAPAPEVKKEVETEGQIEDIEPLDPVVKLSEATILAVDDDIDLIEFISEELESYAGRVLTAGNGIEALEILKRENVNLIVSDVMMPKMDGFEFCQKVKTTIEISHIPVVLLTARSDEKSRQIGYKNGADDYVVKPFDTENLVDILTRLLQKRETMRSRFTAGGDSPDIEEATFSSADEEFFRNLDEVISRNITDTELSTHLICKEMAMSRTLLYNKIRNLSGMSIKDYITKVRMDYAVKLLKETEMSVQEISERCGYTTSRYFSTAFKAYTGKTPTEFRR